VRAGGGAAVAGEVFVSLFEAFPVIRGAIPAGGVDLDVRVVLVKVDRLGTLVPVPLQLVDE
jgi:hypothetical protein